MNDFAKKPSRDKNFAEMDYEQKKVIGLLIARNKKSDINVYVEGEKVAYNPIHFSCHFVLRESARDQCLCAIARP